MVCCLGFHFQPDTSLSRSPSGTALLFSGTLKMRPGIWSTPGSLSPSSDYPCLSFVGTTVPSKVQNHYPFQSPSKISFSIQFKSRNLTFLRHYSEIYSISSNQQGVGKELKQRRCYFGFKISRVPCQKMKSTTHSC